MSNDNRGNSILRDKVKKARVILSIGKNEIEYSVIGGIYLALKISINIKIKVSWTI